MASFMFTQEKNGAESNLLVTIPQTCVTKFIIKATNYKFLFLVNKIMEMICPDRFLIYRCPNYLSHDVDYVKMCI